jgi:hypothetical protein
MHDLRERAKNIMDDLITVLEIIGKVSKHPERDFAKIFQNEDRYVGMVNACHEAYRKSYESKVRLADENNWTFLIRASWEAGLSKYSEKDMFDAGKREALVDTLKRLGKRDGKDYLKRGGQDAFMQKDREKSLWLATCPNCRLEQLPNTSIDPCPKCGFKGPVFPNHEYFPRA